MNCFKCKKPLTEEEIEKNQIKFVDATCLSPSCREHNVVTYCNYCLMRTRPYTYSRMIKK